MVKSCFRPLLTALAFNDAYLAYPERRKRKLTIEHQK